MTADSSKTTFTMVTVIFILLAILFSGVVALYWVTALEPRLKAEAVSQAEILARSQADFVGDSVRAEGDVETRRRRVTAAESIELKVDYSVVPVPAGSLDLGRGARHDHGFRVEVALYDRQSSELLGIAAFRVSDAFFVALSRDVRRDLTVVSLAVVLLLSCMYAVLLAVLRKLQRQRAERDHAHRELLEQEQKYHRLVNSLSTYFVYGKDADGRVTFISDSALRIFGLPAHDLMLRLQNPIVSVALPRANAPESEHTRTRSSCKARTAGCITSSCRRFAPMTMTVASKGSTASRATSRRSASCRRSCASRRSRRRRPTAPRVTSWPI